ncbi:MAG: site-specific integrase [Magnetococcales bacterium]|nr:site-specific integrase [Magnetococcales bacterium]
MATIRRTPSGTWQVQVRRQGHPSVTKTFRLRRDAETYARQIEDEIVRGIFLDRTMAEQMTVASALQRYLVEVSSSKAPTTARSEKSKAAHLMAAFGKYSLAVITPDKVGCYRDDRLKTASANQVRLELALFAHLFSTAIREWGVGLAFNPVRSIRKPPPGAGRHRRLTPDEETRLLAACDAHSNPMLGWIVRVAIATAMRHGEIVSLELRQVDINRRVVVLEQTKNGDARTVPLSLKATDVMRIVLEWPLRPDDTKLLFPGEPGKDGQRRPYVTGQVWRHVLLRAGIVDLHFHDLRHEAVSRLVEAGLSDQEVAAISGHRSMQMLRRYTHLRGEDLVNRLDRAESRR